MPEMEAVIRQDKLKDLLSTMPGISDRVMEAGADVVVEEAQRRAPVLTGFLKKTIGKIKRGGRWIAFALAHYASYVEFGTRKMAAQPFMRPALESVNWPRIIRQLFRNIGL